MRADELDFFSLVEFAPERGEIQFSGRRAILLHTDAMGALRKELVETLGADIAKVILTRYGFSCGHEDASLLAGLMNPDTVEEFVRGGPRTHMFSGIAQVETHTLEVDRARGHYRMSGYWRHSYEAEQHLRLFGTADESVCWTLAGYASGFASYVFDADMICVEQACEGRGDDHCAWTLMNVSEGDPALAELRKYFQPLNIKDRINVLESRVYERTRELEASEQRYRNLIEDLPEMVFALHVSGRLVQLNKAGRTRLGIALEQLPELRLKDLVLPEYRSQAASFLKRIAGARAATRLDVVMRDATGREVPMRLQVEPVMKDGRIVGYSGLAIDISAQQERERKLTEYAATLENREQQMIAARREMERQLAQANRLSALGQFASGIAHEINNPLGLVSGFAEELQALMEHIPGAVGNPDFAVLRQGLTTIQEQAQRCKAITDNLLLFSRQQAVPLEVIDAEAFLRERLASYATIGLTRGLQIEFDVCGALPVVAGNPTLLDQVVQNLLKNARDAMGGSGRAQVRMSPAPGGIQLEVADEGPGLPAGVIDRVFDPFFTTKPPGRGTGLGLSICYGIMSELRGRIDCGNRPEGGAWFRLFLPAYEPGMESTVQ